MILKYFTLLISSHNLEMSVKLFLCQYMGKQRDLVLHPRLAEW